MKNFHPILYGIASFIIPGLGQAFLRQWFFAVVLFFSAAVLWKISFGTLGWIVHLIAAWTAYVDGKKSLNG